MGLFKVLSDDWSVGWLTTGACRLSYLSTIYQQHLVSGSYCSNLYVSRRTPTLGDKRPRHATGDNSILPRVQRSQVQPKLIKILVLQQLCIFKLKEALKDKRYLQTFEERQLCDFGFFCQVWSDRGRDFTGCIIWKVSEVKKTEIFQWLSGGRSILWWSCFAIHCQEEEDGSVSHCC